jgi:hypothetical protein
MLLFVLDMNCGKEAQWVMRAYIAGIWNMLKCSIPLHFDGKHGSSFNLIKNYIIFIFWEMEYSYTETQNSRVCRDWI